MSRSRAASGFWFVLAGALAIATYGGVKYVQARGIRNNNPGNIRLGSQWAGQVPASEQTDAAFVQFISPEYGIRAMNRILNSYASRGLVTIRSILNTWAPPTENNTAAYRANVSSALGVGQDAPLSNAQRPALIAAIIQHENGTQPYDASLIARGISMT